MQTITYSLRNEQKHSDQFYLDLSDYTDLILAEAYERFEFLLAAFQRETGVEGGASQRTFPELAFDLLVLGVLWRVYANEAVKSSGRFQKLLARLVQIRSKFPLLKPGADLLRGVVGGFTLHTDQLDGRDGVISEEGLEKFISWLKASGEFKEEIRRMEAWSRFFTTQNQYTEYLEEIIKFAKYFEKSSLKALGEYTQNVDLFLKDSHPGYRWREDFFFTGRQREEYHLNMVGMEIMNRSFRDDFLRAERKIIFVPPCMSAPQDGKCQSVETSYGARCASCTPGCRVNQITKLGDKKGIQVFMIPDSFSPLSKSGAQPMDHASIGVVGVSCPLTIISGGFEMKRLGIPAQGVLLDYCGCSWHWDPGKGIVTDLNFKQLRKILEDENGQLEI